MPILSEFRKQRQGNFEFEASLEYTATSRLAVIHSKQNPAPNTKMLVRACMQFCAEGLSSVLRSLGSWPQRVEGKKTKSTCTTSTVE